MHIPIATYRIQFNPSHTTFSSIQGIIAYLHTLGVSDIYASPIFKARKGSQHGYDIVDPTRLNPELGDNSDFDELIKCLKDSGMFWIQDIVPNHMAYSSENAMLMDVFELGKDSQYYEFFDIDWEHSEESFRGRVLAPFLGEFYADAIESCKIQLKYSSKGFFIEYYDLQFPILLTTYKDILFRNINMLEEKVGKNGVDLIEFLGNIKLLESTLNNSNKQYGQVDHVKEMLWKTYQKQPVIKSFIDNTVKFFNGTPGNPKSFQSLDELLSKQCYRLSFWKVASEELNYRRFFTINEMIALRSERREVRETTHRMVFNLINEKKIDGLRIDHIDGLYNPTKYLTNLREKIGDTYLIVEKILESNEKIPSGWPIQGTTGYDFISYVNGIFCQKDNKRAFSKIYHEFSELHKSYSTIVCEKKRLIIGKHMAGDIDNLAQHMKKIVSLQRRGQDITLYGLKRALVEVIAFFPVYRTYFSKDSNWKADKAYMNEAIKKACEKEPGLIYEFKFIKEFFNIELIKERGGEEAKKFWNFIMRFQQITGPIMAKGFEDTFFYVYNRLISLNEVGNDPGNFGVLLEDFHKFNWNRFSSFPFSLNTTATHDTKRGEDVRARLNVLSEIPDEWEKQLKHWSLINKGKKNNKNARIYPDANDEYLIYQALLGSFPFNERELGNFTKRIAKYIVKAVREAKTYTAWVKPDIAYEKSCVSFVKSLIDSDEKNRFLKKFLPFQRKIAYYGIFNSLSQTLIKMTAPGVPDFYQGNELWDFSFVDPDNRRPVDYKARVKSLDYISRKIPENILRLMQELLDTKEDGRVKLFLIHRILYARKNYLDIFQKGQYIPLKVEGRFKDSVIAYARKVNTQWSLVVAPRFLTRVIKEGEYPFAKIWGNTRIVLPGKCPSLWIDMITSQEIQCGNKVPVEKILTCFPVSLLINKS